MRARKQCSLVKEKNMFENDTNSILELIDAINEVEDESFTEEAAGIIIDASLKRFEKELTPDNIKKMYVEAVSRGMTKDDIIAGRNDVKEKVDAIVNEAGFTNVYKTQVLSAILNALVSLYDKVIERFGNYVTTVYFEKTIDTAKLPTYAHEEDACCDVYCPEEVVIPAGARGFKVNTGLKAAIPMDYELLVRARSGISMKTPLRISNGQGTIDENYLGPICVLFDNISNEDYTINVNDRIAQLALKPVYRFKSEFVDSVEDIKTSTRGEGGFGSSVNANDTSRL